MYRLYFLPLSIFVLFGVAHSVSASVVINEIAWMGTSTSTNDEWIELKNTDATPVVLDGWTLSAADGSPRINLQGTIPASGYFLLERTDDTTVPDIPADMIYSGALGNDGEKLVLKNNTENVIDTVDMSAGWTAGDAASKQTAQLVNGSWITATATPRAANPNSGNSGNTTSGSGSNTVSTITHAESENHFNKEEDIVFNYNPIFTARMITPDIFVQEVPAEFDAEVKESRGKTTFTDIDGKYVWSMGDGASFVFTKDKPFSYTYRAPGQYVVMLRYFSNTMETKPDAVHQKTITVIPATIRVTTDSFGTVALENKSTDDIDLAGWKLSWNGATFTFPEYTILKKDSTLSVPVSVHQLPPGIPTLITPTGYQASGVPMHRVMSATINELAPKDEMMQSNTTDLYASASDTLPTQSTVPFTKSIFFWVLTMVIFSGIILYGYHMIHQNHPDTQETK